MGSAGAAAGLLRGPVAYSRPMARPRRRGAAQEEIMLRSLRLLLGTVLGGTLFAVLVLVGARSTAAQTTGPADFTQFGYPHVAASVMFTPGTAATLTAGTQQVVLPADFISKTVQFELLTGDASFFTPLLESDDQARPILAAWAFRVTDPATGQRV